MRWIHNSVNFFQLSSPSIGCCFLIRTAFRYDVVYPGDLLRRPIRRTIRFHCRLARRISGFKRPPSVPAVRLRGLADCNLGSATHRKISLCRASFCPSCRACTSPSNSSCCGLTGPQLRCSAGLDGFVRKSSLTPESVTANRLLQT